MVELVKIADEDGLNNGVLPEEQVVATKDESEYEEESDVSDDDDDYDENETIVERIQALADIFSPEQKKFVSSVASYTSATVSALAGKAGSGLWILATSALLIGFPITAGILGETQLIELEKEMNLQQNGGVAPGLAGEAADPLLSSGDAEKK